MRAAFGWICVVLAALAGVLLFAAGGMYIGLLLIGLSIASATALITVRLVRDS